jgi:hypothetical protein
LNSRERSKKGFDDLPAVDRFLIWTAVVIVGLAVAVVLFYYLFFWFLELLP